ncbi:MAG: DUF1826 domain-containing protein [Pseudomonadota bacterium]
MNMILPSISESIDISLFRKPALSDHASVFSEIYQEDINIAIWQRNLATDLQTSVARFIDIHDHFRISLVANPDVIFDDLIKAESSLRKVPELCTDITELVGIFCVLFGVEQAGLRLTVMNDAMCPRFHVDRVPCRLICSYHGVASEWLPHEKVDRTKLGTGNNGLCDEESGLFTSLSDVNQLNVGDVALLKGEIWEGNINAGLVHRSPKVTQGNKRLLLTLDFLN